MGGANERRKHRRLPVRAIISCRKIGSIYDHIFSGNTVDIGTSGLLVECGHKEVVNAGDLFNIELDLPDADSIHPFGSKVSAYARVVRIVDVPVQQKAGKKHIAFQFCSRPQFDIQ